MRTDYNLYKTRRRGWFSEWTGPETIKQTPPMVVNWEPDSPPNLES